MTPRVVSGSFFALTLTLALAANGAAQELEPRAFSPVPVGMNFVAAAYGYSTGNILLETALPIENLTAKLHTPIAVYVRAIDFFGMSAKVDGVVPFATATWRGQLAGVDTSTSRTGFGDPKFRLAVSFLGAPAMRAREFRQFKQKTIVGASLQVTAPLGQYDPSKLINLGSNRWTFKPRLGISQALGRWVLDFYATAWLFTHNTDFFGGNTLDQAPFFALQAHVAYVFKSGVWVAVDGGLGGGGRTTVSGAEASVNQRNWRFGTTLAIPLAPQHSVKLAWVSGVSTRLGSDFDTYVIAYQFRWGGVPKAPPGGQ